MKKLLAMLSFIFVITFMVGIFSACAGNVAPSAPENLQWDMEEWTISWDEAENAQSYNLRIDDEQEIYETAQTEYDFEHILVTESTNIISVCSVNSKGQTSDWVQLQVETETPTAALVYTLNSSGTGYKVTRYYFDVETGLEGRVVIADYYEGLPVTSIASNAFYVPKVIGSSIEEYNTVTTGVHLPKNLKSIGSNAFRKCTGIQEIKMPDTVTSIGDYAFGECESLTEINLSEEIITIESNMLAQTAITHITIPSGVTKINSEAFYNCGSLVSVDMPETIMYIGNSAFEKCVNLIAIDLYENIDTIKKAAFKDCESLLYVQLPESVTQIENSTFSGCISLTSFTVNRNITSIGSGAFYNCLKLMEVINLSSLEIEAGSQGNGYIAYYAQNVYTQSGFSEVIEQYDCKFIYDGSSYYLYSYSGSGELNLSALMVDGESKYYEISDYAFYRNRQITSVTMDGYVTGIGEYAFAYCTSLKSVVLPENLESIAGYTFYYCTSLKSVQLPENLTDIGEYAFYRCYLLYDIKLPESLINIGTYAFLSCSIYSVFIGENVVSIGWSAFAGCHKLVEVYNLSSFEFELGKTTNGYVAFNAVYLYTSADVQSVVFTQDDYVFCCLDNAYYLLEYIGEDTGLIFPTLTINGENTEYEIYTFAFYWNTEITSVTIPEGITAIGKSAFSYCSSLKYINIGEDVTYIGGNAFYKCSSLKSATVENVSGWYVQLSESSTEIGISKATMGNSAMIASYFTDKYEYYSWYCTD